MGRISDFRDSPRVVTLAGRRFLVGELRLADVCDFQDWLDRRWAAGFAGVEPLLDAEEVPAADRGAFAAALALVDEGPPAWDDRRSREAFATDEGLFVFLRTVLRRHQPDLTAGDVIELMVGMKPEEYGGLARAVYRADPGRAVVRAFERLTGTEGRHEEGPPPRWGEWIEGVARSHQGWTYEYILSLTLTQFFAALNEGKSSDRGGRRWRGEDVGAIRRRRRAWLAGEDLDAKGGG